MGVIIIIMEPLLFQEITIILLGTEFCNLCYLKVK